MYFWYNLFLRAATLVVLPALPVLLGKKKIRQGLWARLGFLPRVQREAFGDLPRPRVWFHAASLGELTSLAPIVTGFKERYPSACPVVSTTTVSALRMVAQKVPEAALAFLLPLDFSGAVRRVLRWCEPDMLVITETELWPNLLRLVKKSGAQIALINGRLSERSFRRYRWIGRLVAKMLAAFDLVSVQSEKDAERFLALGANPQRVLVTGNAKVDTRQEYSPETLRQELRLRPEQPVWVAGSTRPGEEELILQAFARVRERIPETVLILAPRHLERLREVEKLLMQTQVPFTYRTRVSRELINFPVILLDTMGELAKIYGAGGVAFVGGSLVPLGGHNPLEPAAQGVPVVMGPHTEHFAKTVEALVKQGGAQIVSSADELAQAVAALLQNGEEARRRGALARQSVLASQGVAVRNAELLRKLMLIKSWGREVKGWRAETVAQAGARSTGPEHAPDDWPEWP